MFENINEIAVLVSAILSMAIGSVWYSPLLFGNHWMKAAGLTEEDIENAKGKMLKLFAIAMIVNIFLVYILAQFVALSQMGDVSIRVIATLLISFLAAIMSGAVIWEQRPLSYLLINIGYAAVIVFGGMTVLWYWPW